jgi:dephospho-CoA kinase
VTLFGITGGIGMGKSTAGQLLKERGVSVVDTDTIAKQLTEPGRPAVEEIQRRFGPVVLSPIGGIDRAALAKIVFTDAQARADLEAILHPGIRAAWEAIVSGWNRSGVERAAVLIPLLFETGAETRFDAVICLACSEMSQVQRLRLRGWDDSQIRQRVAAQWPLERKVLRSDFMVWSDTTLDAHAAQLERVVFQRKITSSKASGARA